jgi:hypothetical protein
MREEVLKNQYRGQRLRRQGLCQVDARYPPASRRYRHPVRAHAWEYCLVRYKDDYASRAYYPDFPRHGSDYYL